MTPLEVQDLVEANFFLYPRAEQEGQQVLHSRQLTSARSRESFWVLASASTLPSGHPSSDACVAAVEYYFAIGHAGEAQGTFYAVVEMFETSKVDQYGSELLRVNNQRHHRSTL
jgi:hypothetical protein